MKLKHLWLENFCQHECLDVDISNGLTGILGSNGSGKSNLIQGLIYAITGTASNNLEHYIRKGSNGISLVKLTFYSDLTGLEYTISRSIKPRKAELSCSANGLMIRKAKDVDAYLTDVLKIDFNIVRNVLAVNQEDFVAFLRSTASERSALLMRLFGFMEFKTAREAFRQVLLDSSTDKDYSAELKAKKELLEIELRSLEPYKDLPDKTKVTDDYRAYQGKLAEANALINLYKTRDYFLSQEKAIRLNIDATTVKLSELHEIEDVSSLEKSCDNYKESLKLVNEQYADSLRLDSYVNDIVSKQKRFFDEREKFLQLYNRCISPEEYDNLASRYFAIKQTVEDLEKFEASGCCPTCGQPFPDLDKKLSSARSELKEVSTEYEIQTDRKNASDDQYRVTSSWEFALKDTINNAYNWMNETKQNVDYQQSTRCENRLYMVLSSFPNYENWSSVPIREDWVASVKDVVKYLNNCSVYYSSKAKEIEARLAPMKEVVKKHAELTSQLEIYTNQLKDITEHMPVISADTISYEDATALVASSGKTTAEYIQLFETFSRVDAIQSRITQLRASIRSLEGLVDHDVERIKYQNAVREAYDVLHPDALPKAVMVGLLDMLSVNINYYLSLFDAPFTVSINPDSTELLCTFTEGETFVASELSGGQKMVLAISWRLALHNTFSSEESCGFITLDEPTNHLDADNIQNLTQVMNQVKQAAQDKNLQVLVITHEKALEPLFDSVVRL